ncbi:TPA: hypothetical protein ACQ301_000326 [Yersinia enterocolitica]
MENSDRVYRALNIHGDELVECLVTDGLLIRPFERHLSMPDAVRWQNRMDILMNGNRFQADARSTFCNACNDHIVRDAAGSGLIVTAILHQLSCIVCLQECNDGGALRIYNKKWQPEDERFKTPGELGYRDGIKEGGESCEFYPLSGDIYIFNPAYYHEIDRVVGDTRITMGFFFGITDRNMKQAIAWS